MTFLSKKKQLRRRSFRQALKKVYKQVTEVAQKGFAKITAKSITDAAQKGFATVKKHVIEPVRGFLQPRKLSLSRLRRRLESTFADYTKDLREAIWHYLKTYRSSPDIQAIIEATRTGADNWIEVLEEGDPTYSELWPAEKENLQPIIELIDRLGLTRLTKGSNALTQSLMITVFKYLATTEKNSTEALAKVKKELAGMEAKERKMDSLSDEETQAALAHMESRLEKILRRSRGLPQRSIAHGMQLFAQANFKDKVQQMLSFTEAFGSADAMHRATGWDLSLGVWHDAGWGELYQYYEEYVKGQQEVINLAQRIGRQIVIEQPNNRGVQEHPHATPVDEEVSHLQQRLTPGYRLGQELHQLLTSEKLLLVAPEFEPLLMAKFASGNLLCQQRMGTKRTWQPTTRTQASDSIEKVQGRGPVILCVDTSGSMHGRDTIIAKSVTLAVALIAFEQQRACHLMSFSGPGQTEGVELALDQDGLSQLLEFLRNSFDGGTDVDTPLREATRIMQQSAFARADVVVISDGHFYPPNQQVLEQLRTAGKAGARVFGVSTSGNLHTLSQFANDVIDASRFLQRVY